MSDTNRGTKHRTLIEAAERARESALAPYSNFRVGAALETEDEIIYIGCNVESATYGQTMCAERVAVWKALSEGARKFTGLAVVADTENLTPPCGACRQVLWEFCGDLPVVLANLRGNIEVIQMSDLFPRPFDARFLKKTNA
ncbi:MAG TPA: cytidine deaminase [Pyrinomonadaceae bacterium]|nr:cytidine deaminase [Pyrinomonadaceae bacterium]